MAFTGTKECFAQSAKDHDLKLCSPLGILSSYGTITAQDCRPAYSHLRQHQPRHSRRNNVNNCKDQNRILSGIPAQQSYLFNCNIPFSTDSESALQNKTSYYSHSLTHPSEGTFCFQQMLHVNRPYQKLETFSLKPRILGKRAFSSPYPPTPICLSPPKSQTSAKFQSESANSFLGGHSCVPSIAREHPGVRVGNSVAISGKPVLASYKPALNKNTFMRPTSAKVPLHHTKEGRNCKPSSLGSAHHFGESGGVTYVNLDTSPLKHHNAITAQTEVEVLNTALPPVNIVAKTECASSHMEESLHHSKSFVQDARDPQITFTEAVRKLAASTGNCLKNGLSNGLGNFAQCCEHNPVIGTNLLKGFCRKTGEITENTMVPHMTQGETKIFIATKTGTACLANGITDTASIESPVCISQSDTAAPDTISIGDGNESLSKAQTTQPSVSHGQGMKVRLSRCTSVSLVTTRISAIHLDKGIAEGEVMGSGEDAEMKDSESSVSHLQEEDEGEELLDGLEDECSQEDEELVCSSDLEASSLTSLAGLSRNCFQNSVQLSDTDSKIVKPALVPSLFPSLPSTVYFATQNERVELLPWPQRKLLKWKMSTVTPNIVKQTIQRSHFRVTRKSYDWLGCWGHHMKSPGFKALREHQKLNHFPGSFQIGRKDRLWRNLSKMQSRFGKKEFNFFPQSFVLPKDIKLLKKAWEEGGSHQKWIVKPPASARGIGIQVVHKWSQVPRKRPLLVQRYLHKPYLISGSKFDLRIYVYVTSYDPLRIYIFTDGLVRFASCKYSSSMKSLSNKFMHLTNYSVNKKNSDYKSNTDETACQGHKWSLKALWNYLSQKGVNTDAVWEKLKDIVIKTIIASEPYVNTLVKMHVRHPNSCHELFGFDIMLDENMKPWVLEVNISPSLHSNSPLDVSIKGQMIRDLLNLAGFVLPYKDEVTAHSESGSAASLCASAKEKPRRILELSSDEKMKRAYFLNQKFSDQESYSTVLDILTPDDVRILVETEDELSRCGEFERIFPSPFSSRYLRFFEQPRYLNILLSQWEQKSFNCRQKGIDLLRALCQKGVHLGINSDAVHVWSSARLQLTQKTETHLNGFSKPDLPAQSKIAVQKEKANDTDDLSKNHKSVPSLQNLSVMSRLTPTLLKHAFSSLPDITQIA